MTVTWVIAIGGVWQSAVTNASQNVARTRMARGDYDSLLRAVWEIGQSCRLLAWYITNSPSPIYYVHRAVDGAFPSQQDHQRRSRRGKEEVALCFESRFWHFASRWLRALRHRSEPPMASPICKASGAMQPLRLWNVRL